MKTPSEPMLNVPPVVTALLAAFGIIHAVRVLLLSPQADFEFLLLFAFVPARTTRLWWRRVWPADSPRKSGPS